MRDKDTKDIKGPIDAKDDKDKDKDKKIISTTMGFGIVLTHDEANALCASHEHHVDTMIWIIPQLKHFCNMKFPDLKHRYTVRTVTSHNHGGSDYDAYIIGLEFEHKEYDMYQNDSVLFTSAHLSGMGVDITADFVRFLEENPELKKYRSDHFVIYE